MPAADWQWLNGKNASAKSALFAFRLNGCSSQASPLAELAMQSGALMSGRAARAWVAIGEFETIDFQMA